MMDLLIQSTVLGIVGSVGATIAILIFRLIREGNVRPLIGLLIQSAVLGVVGSVGATIAILIFRLITVGN